MSTDAAEGGRVRRRRSGLHRRWGEALEAADVAVTMVVGVHRLTDETCG